MFKKIILGFLIGASIIIPGMSGGTTAILLGVFDEIIVAVNGLFGKPIKSMLKLCPYMSGILLGSICVCAPISFICDNYPVEFSFFIIGIIIGCSYTFLNGNKIAHKNKPTFFLVGLFGVLICNYFFENINVSHNSIIINVLVALLSSVALILPGVSFTNILIMFGKYNEFVTAVKNNDIPFLSVFLSFLFIGTFVFIRLFTKLYQKYKDETDLILLGMIFASIPQIYNGLPNKNNTLECVLLFIGACALSLLICIFERGTNRT